MARRLTLNPASDILEDPFARALLFILTVIDLANDFVAVLLNSDLLLIRGGTGATGYYYPVGAKLLGIPVA